MLSLGRSLLIVVIAAICALVPAAFLRSAIQIAQQLRPNNEWVLFLFLWLPAFVLLFILIWKQRRVEEN